MLLFLIGAVIYAFAFAGKRSETAFIVLITLGAGIAYLGLVTMIMPFLDAYCAKNVCTR